MTEPVRSPASAYAGRRMVLLTRHGKQAQIGPLLEAAIACTVEVNEQFDTDRLGTFTREVARAGSQLEAARHKARLALELGDCAFGLGSEGAFFSDPVSGLLPWNRELVVLVDAERRIEVCGVAHGPAWNSHRQTGDWDELLAFAEAAGFPDQQLVLRPLDAARAGLRKGIGDCGTLAAAFQWAVSQSPSAMVLAETDLRAHCSPRRRQRIAEAATDLARRLRSLCPRCAAPGFWLGEKRPGLPCAWCGEPTELAVAEIEACVRCAHRVERAAAGAAEADPAHCRVCNP
ncbi:DUF6671 family protein [Dokdonella immobilis]|uniref:DUF6671 domain-containing protein n=1 Tax=Dokdonella immobilis TaxID=578942 RepID=A0A1I4X739_9GAMM|nr:DUF6671 family protein [Dokdonella immobilis]SFN21707.1 hypothetical protein SAMN05216289_10843 [Dokdonella immobilis]